MSVAQKLRMQNIPLPSARLLCQVNSDDFGSLIAFASQLIVVLHDCLNRTGGAPKSQGQVIVYAHERTFLRSITHCWSMDSLPEVAYDHKAHRHGNEQICNILVSLLGN